jgi:cap2 methyltransferase
MKMYETMNLIDFKKTSKSVTSFHVAEAPGNFILAINQWMYSHHPNTEWNWYASSYIDEFGTKEGKYLEDNYGIMKNYPDKWLYGADSNGDITSCANIETFAETFPKSLDFMTSDVKYVPLVEDYNEEENQNMPVNLGHTLIALRTLKKGGSALLKEFTFMEGAKLSQLFLLACTFKTLKIVKPVTSRPANSEVYLLCKDYKANLSELQIARLMQIMKYVRYLTDGSPSIFQLADIPPKFLEAVITLNKILADQQIAGINRNIELVYAYKNSSLSDIYQNSQTEDRTAAAEKWISDVGITELPDNKKIMRSATPQHFRPRDRQQSY